MIRKITLLLMFLVPSFLGAQIYVDVPSDFNPSTGEITEGNLNNAIQAAINAGQLSNTVFRLVPAGY